MRLSNRRDRLEYARWLDSLAEWKIALTLTFTRVETRGEYRSVSDVAQTTRHLIRLINRACFGHGAVRKGYCVATLYVIEHGYGGRHPHVHATLSLPPRYDYGAMCRLIKERARKLHSIDQQIHLQHYSDFGWADYCLKNGSECLVVEDIRQAKY
jgi:hypothetical protein